MGIYNDINEQENEAIAELRNRMKGEMDSDMYNDRYLLLRFLRARDLNVSNAEAMLRKHIVWREKNDVKNIFKFQKTEVLTKYFSNAFFGYDKEGCVVRYCPAGNLDWIGLLSSMTDEEMNKLIIYESETDTSELKKQSEKFGKNIDKCIYIYNFQNLSFAAATDKRVLYACLHLLRVFVDNYPERLKAAYLINVSLYFNLMFGVIKSMLPKTILSKLHLYSDDSYKEDLLKVIDADVLPGFLGGNRNDPDGNPLCLTFINHGEPVPQSYFLQKKKRSLAKLPGVQKTTLSRAAFHEVNLDVKEPKSYIEWEFETKCRDIGFGLFYNEVVDGEEKITELVPIQRIDTEHYPETGTFHCEKPGTYVIVFDNTYSWVRAKEIYFRTKVVTPEESEAQMKEKL